MQAPAVRFVLLAPSHPGNIGAVARAMKNMGLADLVLVNPREFPHPDAVARASGAEDLLAGARVVDSLAAAIEGCGLVAATTARIRDQNFRVLGLRAAVQRIVQESRTARVAVLFGAERSGLTNEELDNAHLLIRIPANPAYESLNLSMAAQLVAYEIRMALGEEPPPSPGAVPLAPAEEMERLYAHLQQVAEEVDFRDRTQSGTNLMLRIRRFLQRAELDVNEVNILRGLLTSVQGKRRPAGRSDVVYLDYAASSPVDSQVATAMMKALRDSFANPASMHAPGRAAAQLVQDARAQVAQLIGAAADDIIFTSGATESNNLAILGLARGNAPRGNEARRGHLVTLRTEHKSVLDPCRQLEKEGFQVSYLLPGAGGLLEPQHLRDALRADTLLVSLLHVNNETGAAQDLAALAAVCRERGVLLHVDAAQSAGKLPIDVAALGVDALSLTAHKLCGPKGVGALYVARHCRAGLRPLQFGGGQERGLRSGTLPTHQLVGIGAACALAAQLRETEARRVAGLRDALWQGIRDLPGALLNGDAAHRAPGILNVSFEGVEGESLFTGLRGLALSTGSACNSASAEPSYVLRALGRSSELAQSSLRFSLGRYTTSQDVECAVQAVRREVLRLGALSPAPPWAGSNDPTRGWEQQAVVSGAAGSVATGTQLRFFLRVDAETVQEARFQAYGPPQVLAACEWLTGALPGRSRTALVPESPAQWARRLAAPPEKLGNLLIVEDALRNCMAVWPIE